jgi:tetratricopeptide (TPR) repeat protein
MSAKLAAALNNLALLYGDQGRYGEAESLHERSLAIREEALGSDHPDVAITLNNLANLYVAQGWYEEAEPLRERSLAIWEEALGSDHPKVATALNNLANLYGDQGRYGEAEHCMNGRWPFGRKRWARTIRLWRLL